MITRQQLTVINRQTLKYPLQTAEKDYMLTLAMEVIASSPLSKKVVFKGGTALHHCYLEQGRFSEDLDFSTGKLPVTIEEVRQTLTSVPFFEIKKEFQSKATIKIERLLYHGPLEQPNSIKVEIDFLQNVLLPPQTMPYNNAWGVDFKVRVMDIREICAEKIRAMSDRARYRDFYDLRLILDEHPVDLNEVAGYIKRKEIRRPISVESIRANWGIVISQQGVEVADIFVSNPVAETDIVNMIDQLPFDAISG